jgi:hypothetical protein
MPLACASAEGTKLMAVFGQPPSQPGCHPAELETALMPESKGAERRNLV